MKDNHKKYIERTFYLAKKGLGNVSPNPMVGCVIVKNNKIIAEGYHKKFGDKHAEINAINNVKNSKDIEGSTIYINLEPCSHHGKTPPCVDEIIKHSPYKVIISSLDPNPLVNGEGIRKLKENGIEVEINCLEKKEKELNRRFYKNQKKKLPYIILKWAQTEDGFIAKQDGNSRWISNETSRMLVHKWRAEEPGILIGVNTANLDNPNLTVRSWNGKNPTRIVVDPNNKLKNDAFLLRDSHSTLIFNKLIEKKIKNKLYIKINPFNLKMILSDLYKKGVSSILVEGGASTLNHFIKDNLWDEARVFISKTKFKNGILAPKIKLKKGNIIDNDTLYIIRNYA